jgi:hypothetical protein
MMTSHQLASSSLEKDSSPPQLLKPLGRRKIATRNHKQQVYLISQFRLQLEELMVNLAPFSVELPLVALSLEG